MVHPAFLCTYHGVLTPALCRSPKDPTSEREDAWFEIASGPDVATALNLTTGENVTVTLSNYQQPPATDTNGTSPGTNASATPGSGTRRLLHSGLAHGRKGRVLLSNPAPVLEGFEKVGEGESSKEIWTGDPIYVRSSFYIVNFCGFAPSITKEVGTGPGNAGTCPSTGCWWAQGDQRFACSQCGCAAPAACVQLLHTNNEPTSAPVWCTSVSSTMLKRPSRKGGIDTLPSPCLWCM